MIWTQQKPKFCLDFACVLKLKLTSKTFSAVFPPENPPFSHIFVSTSSWLHHRVFYGSLDGGKGPPAAVPPFHLCRRDSLCGPVVLTVLCWEPEPTAGFTKKTLSTPAAFLLYVPRLFMIIVSCKSTSHMMSMTVILF